MSHANFMYPQSTTNDLTLIHNSAWQVREDEDDYANSRPDLPILTEISNLSDFITDKLTKAEALSWVLQGQNITPKTPIP